MNEKRGHIGWHKGFHFVTLQDLALSTVSSVLVILFVGWVARPLALVWLASVLVADLLLTAVFLVLSHSIRSRRQRKRVSSATDPGIKKALVLGTSAESVHLADDVESLGRYQVVGHLTTDVSREGTKVGGRPVYCFHDACDLNSLFWRISGIDNILVPREWDSAFRGATTRPQEPLAFHEESWKKYLMMLNTERKS